MSFRSLRITVLLFLLAILAAITYWESWSVAQWKRPLQIVIYPVPGHASERVRDYTASLSAEQFQEIAKFLTHQSVRYRLQPVPTPIITLGKLVRELPPAGSKGSRSAFDNLILSLKLRTFAFRNAPFWENVGRIRLFVVYHEAQDGQALEHSLGLKKGLFGVVHVFAAATQHAQNNVVITHELLHTLGATDKYDANLMPIFPEGFAESDQDRPTYPQRSAEIMAGRIALSPTRAKIPSGLASCVVGYKTANEISW